MSEKSVSSAHLITEADTSVFVYGSKNQKRGPALREQLPFYNPSMELNRDTSLLVVQNLLNHSSNDLELLDGLAASGIRGIRFCSELKGNFSVVINDISPSAFELITKNIEHSGCSSRAVASNKSIHEVLAKKSFQYVDVDPFGSPIGFLDSAVRAVKHGGILALTATDTACLCGVFPKVCLRRYAAHTQRSPMMHESGLRILLGAVARIAASQDKGIIPILSYYSDHYFRIYVRILCGKKYANDSMNSFRSVDFDCFSFKPQGSVQMMGPLWTGPLHDKQWLADMLKLNAKMQLGCHDQLDKLLELWSKESSAPLFHYQTDILAKNNGFNPPKLDGLFDVFHMKGFFFCRTHFDGTSFKTDAPYDEVVGLVKDFNRKQQKQ